MLVATSVTATVSDMFEEYAHEFSRLRQEFDDQVAAAKASSSSGAETRCVSEAERRVAGAERALKQMEMEAEHFLWVQMSIGGDSFGQTAFRSPPSALHPEKTCSERLGARRPRRGRSWNPGCSCSGPSSRSAGRRWRLPRRRRSGGRCWGPPTTRSRARQSGTASVSWTSTTP
ncbi:unnamed protein product [Prorocentrum cordatum]|uniref:Vesicle transport v-SNARE N-terminal domain-containing protein n=1 Tax=Prorocentrum cordatum TaxID=2364126 RepID=A0ABN9TGD4_9DINO|nr:unnamed protein product [Polarella glacialis]